MNLNYLILISFLFFGCSQEIEEVEIPIEIEEFSQDIDSIQAIIEELPEVDASFKLGGNYINTYYLENSLAMIRNGKTVAEAFSADFEFEGWDKSFVFVDVNDEHFSFDIGFMESEIIVCEEGMVTGKYEGIYDYETFEDGSFRINGGRGPVTSYTKWEQSTLDSIFYSNYSGKFQYSDSLGSKEINLMFDGQIENWRFKDYKLDRAMFGDYYTSMPNSSPVVFAETDTSKLVFDLVLNGNNLEFHNQRSIWNDELDEVETMIQDSLVFTLYRIKG